MIPARWLTIRLAGGVVRLIWWAYAAWRWPHFTRTQFGFVSFGAGPMGFMWWKRVPQ